MVLKLEYASRVSPNRGRDPAGPRLWMRWRCVVAMCGACRGAIVAHHVFDCAFSPAVYCMLRQAESLR